MATANLPVATADYKRAKYLVVKRADLKGHDEFHRNYLSRPVAVQVLGEDDCGLVHVYDHRRNVPFPCLRGSLHSLHMLTCKQRAAVEQFDAEWPI
jgi:hypothetical protein